MACRVWNSTQLPKQARCWRELSTFFNCEWRKASTLSACKQDSNCHLPPSHTFSAVSLQVMASCLLSAKPLPEAMLIYCQLLLGVKFESEYNCFNSRKCIRENVTYLQKFNHFVQASVCVVRYISRHLLTSSCREASSSSRCPHLSRCLARLWPVIWKMVHMGRVANVKKASIHSLAWGLLMMGLLGKKDDQGTLCVPCLGI